MRTLLDILTEQPFFKDLTPEHLTALAENARYRRYKAGELVFHDGNLANRFYVVTAGEVSLEAPAGGGGVVRLQKIGPGELLGWSWMFANAISVLQARAQVPSEVIYFCGENLRRQCDQNPELGYQLFRRVSEIMMQRLQTTRQLVLDQKPTPEPVAQEWRPGQTETAPI
jgi:CRP-like cAMP-binding protein